MARRLQRCCFVSDDRDDQPVRPSKCKVVHLGRYAAAVIWTASEIRARREAKGRTQQQLADAIGAARRSIIAWEAGTSVPQGRFIRQLEDVLGDTAATTPAGTPGPLLAEATFAETLNHLVDLHNDAIRSGINRVLRVEDTPLPADFHADHDVVEGPPVDEQTGGVDATTHESRHQPKE